MQAGMGGGGGPRLGGGEKGWEVKSRRQQHSVLRSHLGRSQSLPLWPHSDQHWPCNTASLLQPKIVFCAEASKLSPPSSMNPCKPRLLPLVPLPLQPYSCLRHPALGHFSSAPTRLPHLTSTPPPTWVSPLPSLEQERKMWKGIRLGTGRKLASGEESHNQAENSE